MATGTGVGVDSGVEVACGGAVACGTVVAVGRDVGVASSPQARAITRNSNIGMKTKDLGLSNQLCTMITPPRFFPDIIVMAPAFSPSYLDRSQMYHITSRFVNTVPL